MRSQVKSLPIFFASAIINSLLLGTGWLWARLVILSYQRREGFIAIGFTPRGAHYEFWGLSVPSYVTGLTLLICVSVTLALLWRQRNFFLLTAFVGYGVVLAATYICLFADLGFEAFD